MRSRLTLVILSTLFVLSACMTTQQARTQTVIDPSARPAASAEKAIAQTLDQLHQRAAIADFDGYFDLYAEGAVFLGTDKAEYWPLAEFKAYTRPHFAKGNGWTYIPIERVLHQNGATAWFEERLQNEKYGEVRGTGVLVLTSAGWKVAQYNLTLPLPNELFGDIATRVGNYYSAQP